MGHNHFASEHIINIQQERYIYTIRELEAVSFFYPLYDRMNSHRLIPRGAGTPRPRRAVEKMRLLVCPKHTP